MIDIVEHEARHLALLYRRMIKQPDRELDEDEPRRCSIREES